MARVMNLSEGGGDRQPSLPVAACFLMLSDANLLVFICDTAVAATEGGHRELAAVDTPVAPEVWAYIYNQLPPSTAYKSHNRAASKV